MNREICVLIYSQYSSASEQLIDYMSKLPYDLAAITGIVLLQADSKAIRDNLIKINVDTVPCIYVKYFDGTQQIYKDEQVYDFITAVTQAVTQAASGSVVENVKPESVMNTAMALQKQRENIEIVKKPEGMILNNQNITDTVPKAIKKNITRFDESVLK
jgi:hypothetical protein